MMLFNLLLLVASLCFADAYSTFGITTRRSTMTMKRGRSFKKEEIGGSPLDAAGMSPSGRNWINVPDSSVKDLPQEDGQVKLIETMAAVLVDRNTNPGGAVAVMKYGPETFCFSSSCPTCKIPLTKAKGVAPNEESMNSPRIVCDFCKATFNLKTGKKVTSEGSSGFFGSIAKTLLSASDTRPLPIYSLGEKNGKILISLD
jgi:nitrite reductase/ring-hydroxylating ferredoxin subunit